MDYLFSFFEVNQVFSINEGLLLIIILVLTVKTSTVSYEYRYFIFSLLIFLVISSIGWLGFTLNFLILLILYSTLLVIFWIFSISFEDFSLKREISESHNVYYTFIVFLFFFLKFPVYVNTSTWYKLVGQPSMISFFSSGQENAEFFILYISVFFYHFLTLCCFFFSLVVICKVVVSLLLIKSKVGVTGTGALSGGKKIKRFVASGTKRVLSWTASFRKVKVRESSSLNNQL